MTNISVELANGQLVVDSRLVAERLEIQHKNFLETIKKHQPKVEERFGMITFETGSSKMPDGRINPKPEKYCYLTEEQATFIMTLSRNSEAVINCKADLVAAFSNAKKLASQPPSSNLVQQHHLSDLVATLLNVFDMTFKGLNIHPNLIAGCKLNATEKILPELRPALDEGRKMLAQTTILPDLLLTPTEIGKRMGISAREVNKLLMDKGYQEKNSDTSKGAPAYLPTEKGDQFCDNTIATGRNGDNSSFQHLKWYPQIIEMLEKSDS